MLKYLRIAVTALSLTACAADSPVGRRSPIGGVEQAFVAITASDYITGRVDAG